MMMLLKDLFQEYKKLAARADRSFREMEKDYKSFIKCGVRCSDCCHSVFGLFLIESLHLGYHFNKLDRRLRREAIQRGTKADRDLQVIEKKLQAYKDNPRLQARAMARERVRCPLLNAAGECLLYPFRPITCRVYGIPAIISGEVHTCWKAGFEKGQDYPAFDLDGMYRELYHLSKRIVERSGAADPERASLLVSVSRTIKSSAEELILMPGS
jgi:Fe-S-cluster containining protein